jgi:DNA-binding SARP family transcriptional activator
MHAPLASPILTFSLLGPFSLRCGEREIFIRSQKLRAMLGYVALSDSLVETRERLVGLLWSESGEEQARAVLRQVVREMRGLLGEIGDDALSLGPREIRLRRDAVVVDVWSVLQTAEDGEAHPLLLESEQVADQLLVGLDDLDPAFHGWVIAKRHALRDRLLRSLERAITDGPMPREEERLAKAILNLDPTHEDACRRLMRARVAAGDTAGALRIYKGLWDLLDEDYGMEPSDATKELVAQIKLGTLEPAPLPLEGVQAATGRRKDSRLMLSIQPVTVQAADQEMAHLVQGFRMHLIASLVRFREWQVTDAPFPPTTGAQTDGRYVLQMTSHQGAHRVHLIIMLKELHTSLYIWSDSFELSLANWFDAQRRVVQRVAMALNVHVSAERLRRFADLPDVSLGAYDRWLRCQELVRTFDAEHLDRAEQQFSELVRETPKFAAAWCGLANLANIEHIARPGVFRTRAREKRALEMAQRAVELDPSDSGARRCLAWSHAMAKQYAQSELQIELACELNPSDSWTVISAALLLLFCGRPDRCRELLGGPGMDITLAPTASHWLYLFDIHVLSGDYEAALSIADHALGVQRWHRFAFTAVALAHLGRQAEAADEAAQFLTAVREQWFGAQPATDVAIVSWLLHLYPISRREDWERLRDGLRAAGLPTAGAEHHAW